MEERYLDDHPTIGVATIHGWNNPQEVLMKENLTV